MSSRLAVLEEVGRQRANRGPEGQLWPQWSDAQWAEAFSFLFTGKHEGVEHDDLLFFVLSSQAAGANGERFTLRRKVGSGQLPAEFGISGKRFGDVAWAETLLLNLVLQARFQLTVIACSQERLPEVAEGKYRGRAAAGIVAVAKPVYASPSHTPVNLEAGKAHHQAPQPSYPNICFAVDFEDAFEDVVLMQPDDCYCVLLHALDPQQLGQGSTPAGAPATGAETGGPAGTVLFSAYVVHQQITGYLQSFPPKQQAAASPLGNALGKLLGWGSGSSKGAQQKQGPRQELVNMTGPGGVGKAEVAVTVLEGAGIQGPGTVSGVAAGQAAGAGAQTGAGNDGVAQQQASQQLRCALASISMNVEVLAREVLRGLIGEG